VQNSVSGEGTTKPFAFIVWIMLPVWRNKSRNAISIPVCGQEKSFLRPGTSTYGPYLVRLFLLESACAGSPSSR